MAPTLFARLEKTIVARYATWLDRRIPPRPSITLRQDNIFIYPNWQFIYYFIVVMVLWLAATNYSNNLAFALCFLLLSIFVVGILHTFANLSGLVVTVVGAAPVFAGDYAEVELELSTAERRPRDALALWWEREQVAMASLVAERRVRVRVPVRAAARGWFNPKRLTLETVYPLGIIRGVSYLDLDVRILAYPRPVNHAALRSDVAGSGEGEQLTARRGSDEFSHLRDYAAGDSLKQVAWKQLAKGRDLQVKEYGDRVEQHAWLDFEAYPALALEARLSNLCYWALELEKRGEPYGLRLPGTVIKPDSGAQHLQAVLTALALHGVAT